MAAVWSDAHRLDLMLETELLVCEALARRGVIPEAAVAELRSQASVDPARVAEIEAEVKHDVIAFVSAAAETVGEAGRFLHFGMTSSDVLDTALALQLVEASRLLEEGIAKLREAVGRRAREHRSTVMAGRTHQGIAWAKLSGAVGSYAHNGPDIEAEVLERLGLRPETVSTQVVPRDRHAAFLGALALVAAAVERFATEVRHMQRTELLEALEPFSSGQKGSSAMPHKRNPILTENLCGLARLVRSHAAIGLENIALWHERDISHSSAERVIMPDATITADFMLARMTTVIEGLEVRPETMAANLDKSGGRWASERLLLALVDRGTAREEAYRWVQRCAMADGDFRKTVAADPDITAQLTAPELADVLDLEHALRHVDTIIDRALEG